MLSAALLLTGCTSITYKGPGGETFRRTSFGTKTAIAVLSVEAGTNGVRKVTMRGYTSDQAEALGVVTEAAVSAAIKGVKP